MSELNLDDPRQHPFVRRPNRTLIGMTVPVLFSLVAEPLTGLADTAFVARLPGSEPVAALGVGTVAFSSIFWICSFLGIGTQTEVANAYGCGERERARKVVSLACMLAVGIGTAMALIAMPILDGIATVLGADGAVNTLACEYLFYRLMAVPPILVLIACFGAVRGVQDMRTPLSVAVGINLVNLLLDWLLIFGVGPFPAMGVGGAAIASTVSQWIGAVWILVVVARRIGLTGNVREARLGKLLKTGGDIFIRTGLVLLFLALCTRVANKAGANQGAAYQAIRQFFFFVTLSLDAFAITGQSLVGYFFGAAERVLARRVAGFVCAWSVGTGLIMCIAMILGESWVAWLLVPSEALTVFGPAWLVVAFSQPVGSLSFATDGIHWGTGDFRYLRNVMIVASFLGGGIVYVCDVVKPEHILVYIWLATTVWTGVRAGFGLVRIWPGIGVAPLKDMWP